MSEGSTDDSCRSSSEVTASPSDSKGSSFFASIYPSVQKAVKARIDAIKPISYKYLDLAKEAFQLKDTVSFGTLITRVVMYENEYNLLDVVAFSLGRLLKKLAAFESESSRTCASSSSMTLRSLPSPT